MNLNTDLFRRQFLLALLLGILQLAVSIKPAAAAPAGEFSLQRTSQKLRVNDPILAREIQEQGGKLIADYGSYQLFRVSDELAQNHARHPKAENATFQNIIALNARPLDTSEASREESSAPAEAGQAKRLHLLQFAGPIKPEWRAELDGLGVEVLSYVPHNAYLVYAQGVTLARMQSWARSAEFVQWEGPYRDEYKIHPRARLINAEGKFQNPPTDLFAIQLAADPGANAATLELIEQLKLEPIKKRAHVLKYLNVIVRLPAERLPEIAAQPEVVSIQPYHEPKKRDERQNLILSGNLSGNGPAAPGYLAWLSSKGFTQAQFTSSGFAVDLTDSGLDNATTLPGHVGLYQFGATNLSSRVIYNRLEGTANNPGSTLQGCDGHGNINGHIIGGYNDRPNGFPHTDSLGYHYGLGVCPFVKVGSSVIFDPDKFTYPQYDDLISRAYNDGARVGNNSWGANSQGDYEIDSQQYDALVRDAQPTGAAFSLPGNQEMVILFAAGNHGPGAQTIGAPGTAKNVITVGAAENVQSHSSANGGNNVFGEDGCGTTDAGADSVNDIIDFSSRGPCTDGRKKPDIVAPGTHVSGGVAQISPAPPVTGNGTALGCFRASGVCSLPFGGSVGNPNNFFPMGQQWYTTSSGTSHSTPAVAGACALLRQYFLNLGSNAPSPALTKALLMNSARYMTGVDANDTLWSHNQGMGSANLGMAFDGASRVIRDQAPTDKFTASGQTRMVTGQIVDPSKPFRVTLVWTDAPGSTFGNAYNNNLDLTVTAGGNSYKGNVFSGAVSVAGGLADTRNNAESVFLPAGVSGNFEVTISAANINSDGVPNEAPALDQDFALVIYNGTERVAPVIVTDGVTVNVESCVPANGSIDPGESVTVNLSLKNTGNSNTVNLVASLQPTGGVTSVSGPQNYGVVVAGGAPVSRSFSFVANGDCGSMLGAMLQLQDATNLGTVTFNIAIGAPSTVTVQNFDGVTAPALPGGWTTTAANGQSAWVTSTIQRDTLPNAAYSANANLIGLNELVSPVIPITSAAPQLSFRQRFDMENGFDGGVLEIKIGNGSFTDILAAGGTFAAGGYTHTLNSSFGNPLGGRQAWSGNSEGFVTTTVNLPALASGQNVQFRWRCGTDQTLAASGWYVDTLTLNGRLCCGSSVVPTPVIEAVNSTLQAEGCAPVNSAPDPGEMVTYSFSLRNIGAVNATNLTATLLATNGVSSPSAPQNYGALSAGGANVSRTFTFTVSGICGGMINPTFQIQDGSQTLSNVAFGLQLGQFMNTFAENFDGVAAPNLPGGWTATGGGGQAAWVTSASVKDTSPNSAFSSGAGTSGTNQLITPSINLPASPVQLSFRNNYTFEVSASGNTGYDGGVLEIKIGAGAFTDIFTAGGSFVGGGYSHVISTSYGNPLGGRRCWSGDSGGFITTTILLPAAASGQPVQLRWRAATDNGVASPGWYIDTIILTARTCCGEITAPVANFSASPTNGGRPLTVLFNDTSTGTITNRIWNFGNGLTTNTISTSIAIQYGTVGTNTVSLRVEGPLGTNQFTRTNYIVVTNAVSVLVADTAAIIAESCTNAVVDPGEPVTMNFALKNLGTATTTNLIATLQASGGVSSPSSPQFYGALAGGGPAVSRAFSFISTGTCGTTNIATLQLQDGPTNYGTVSFSFVLGNIGSSIFTQNFDTVTAPALPAGWTTSGSGAGVPWVTTSNPRDTVPNSVFSPSTSSAGVAELVSPVIAVPSAGQLSFRHRYEMEYSFDGGILEIKIGSGSFTNIIYAGGSFVTNGYNAPISTNYTNPLKGQPAWTGNTANQFITSIVNLPFAATGQNVQFRWRSGSDEFLANVGWYVDTISLKVYECCANPPAISAHPQNQTVLIGTPATFNVSATGLAPLSYQWRFNSASIPGATSTNFTRANAQPADAGNYNVVVSNPSGSITSSVATLRVVMQPSLLSYKHTNGVFQFVLSGNSGYQYVVEGSTNLSTWSTVTTLNNVSGQVQFTDPFASNFLHRFYRARLVP